MIRHIVLIATDEPAKVDQILDEHLPRMVGVVPGLTGVEIGREDISGLDLARGYNRVAQFTFGYRADLATWDDHPDHDAVRTALRPLTSMLVFDYEV